jgi:hypothetical protein
MMGRKQQFASDAEKQAAYRARKRNINPVTKSCPYCKGDQFLDVTGKVKFFKMLESNGGQVFFCVNCVSFISIDAHNQPVMWNIVVHPNLASV